MRRISLWQPYAQLIAIGAKTYETRSWSPSHQWRGRLCIHAAKRKDPDTRSLCTLRPFVTVLQAAGYPDFDALPLGCIVAVADLTAVYDAGKLATRLRELGSHANELAFGNFAPGRVAWKLENVVALATPIPVMGQQGLFEVTGDLETRVEEAINGKNH